MITISIDGQAGSGKGTVSKMIAKKLNLKHLDTGKIYRSAALYVINKGIDPNDEAAVVREIVNFKIDTQDLNDPELQKERVGSMASIISKYPKVRESLLDAQRNFAQNIPEGYNGVILDGRDIGTVVLPNADAKIFLTASAEVRAKRRLKDMQNFGENPSYKEILKAIKERDERDSKRENSPMIPAKDAFVIDTSNLSIDEVFSKCIDFINNKIKTKITREQK